MFIKTYLCVKCERVYHQKYFFKVPNTQFDLEIVNVEDQGQQQWLYWTVLIKANLHVKYKRIVIESILSADLNANLYLTLKSEMLKNNFNIMACNG